MRQRVIIIRRAVVFHWRYTGGLQITYHLIPNTPDTGSVSLFFPPTSGFHGKLCTPVWKSLIKTVFLIKCRRLSGGKVAFYCASGRGSVGVVVSTDQGGDRLLERFCECQGKSVKLELFFEIDHLY